jgi:hypothetical protein
MKKILAILFCAFFVTAITAQERSGGIVGRVLDSEGNPLPGVTLTLTGKTIAPIPVQSSVEGRFRFLSLFPANDYAIKAELQGFKTKSQTGIIVNVGKNSDIVITMEQGGLEEQITVIAQTPIVEAKKAQITHTVTYDMLQSLPSARDPWVILQMTPSIQLDRENIGGVESGQQSSYFAKGSSTQEWTVDGMQTTDRNSGGSPGYYDFDSFEEMNISTGTLDVEHRDPGVVVNIVTRRGGNKLSLGGRFYWVDEKFQKTVPQAKIDEYGVAGYNHAVDIKDFGFNAGGPFVKDKAWWWMSYGIQQVQTLNLYNTRDDTYLSNYNAKINLQLIPQNRFEALVMLGDKKKFGRSSSASDPLGWNQGSKFHFGNPTYKFQDEHMFGDNLFLSLRVGKSNAGFGMTPVSNLALDTFTKYDVEQDLYYNSETYFYSDRPHPYGVVQAQYFNDNLFGTAHEIKVGFEVNNNNRTYIGGYPGNIKWSEHYYYDIVDFGGPGVDGVWHTADDVLGVPDGHIDTPYYDYPFDIVRLRNYRNDAFWHDGSNRIAAYFNDTISFGRFNINIGFRLDRMKPFIDPNTTRGLFVSGDEVFEDLQANYADIALQVYDSQTINLIRGLLPERNVPRIDAIKNQAVFSPRLGINYDLFGNGKTILKLAYSMYPGNTLGTAYTTPYGRYGYVTFWWADGWGYGANADGANPDGQATWDELYWASYASSARSLYHAFDVDQTFAGNGGRDTGMYSGFSFVPNDDGVYEDLGLTPPQAYVDLANWKPTQRHELSLSVDHEIMRNFGVSANFTYNQLGRQSWSPAYYPEERLDESGSLWPGLLPEDYNHIRSTDDYEAGGVVPDTLYARGPDGVFGTPDDIAYDPKEAAGRTWYVLKNEPYTRSTPYTYLSMMDSARKNKYYGLDLVLTKRLANKWMLNGSFTYQMQKAFYGTSYLDPTNQWAVEGQMYGVTMGGTSGKINQEYFTRWMLKLMGLYQLPWDLNISGTISAHEGTIPAETISFQNRTLPNPYSYSNTMNTTTYNNRERLPNVWVFNFKLEKMLKITDTGRMYFSVDLFNAFNNNVILRRYNASYGTWRFIGAPSTIPNTYYGTATPGSTQPWTRPSSTAGTNNEIMNPLCFRLGLRFQF